MPLPSSGVLTTEAINEEIGRPQTNFFNLVDGLEERYLAASGASGFLEDDFSNVYINDVVYTTSIQSDGKVIIGGMFTSCNGKTRNRIARLHSNGVLDTDFNVGDGATNDVCTTSIQSDGRVIIGGDFTSYSGTTTNRIARLHSNGVLDTGFNVGTGANRNVRTTSIQSDGRVIIGGGFTIYSGTTTNRIARLHSNGVLDTGFNVGTGASGGFNIVNTTSIQPDGRVIIGGGFTIYSGTTTNRIARLHSNGVLDTDFNIGTGANSNVCTTSIQLDGRVVIGGFFTVYSGTIRNRIARLHSNGVLDTDFNVGTGANNVVSTTSIQSDGKIIIGGSFGSYSGTTRNSIARLHSNGVLDTDFNVGTGANNTVSTTSIQSDGRVIMGGAFTSYSGTAINRIARLHSNGILDTDFNVGTGANGTVETTSIQSDGKVIMGGRFTSYSGTTTNRIARMHSNGVLDTDFNVGTGANSFVDTTSIQSDGKVIIGGVFTLYSGTTRNRIARLHSNGVLDTDFNVGTGITGNFPGVFTTHIQSDGKVIIGGFFTVYSGTVRNMIARLHSNGVLDTDFNVGDGANSTVSTISIQPDGSVIIGGSFSSYNFPDAAKIARVKSSGVLDTNFNVRLGASFSYVFTTSVQADGRVIIGGNFNQYFEGENKNKIEYLSKPYKLNQNGSSDNSFSAGIGFTDLTYNYPYVINGFIQPDGKFVFAGYFENYKRKPKQSLIRLLPDGEIDYAFNMGTGLEDLDYNYPYLEGLFLQPDGKIIIGGYFSSYNGTSINNLARLHSNGNLDTNFNTGTGPFGDVYAVALQSDGKVIIGGVFTGYNGVTVNRIARLHTNGVLDDTFNIGTGTNDRVIYASVQADDKVIINGRFTSYSGTTTNRIARMHSNGVLDTDFNVGTGANNVVYTTSIQSDGKVIIGGGFTSYSGTTTNYIARLHSNGVLDTDFNVGTGADAYVWKSYIQPDGSIIANGGFSTFNGLDKRYIARLYSNGALDTSFSADVPNDIAVTLTQDDGKLVVAGAVYAYPTGLARINTELYRNPAKLISNSLIEFNDFYNKTFIPVPGTLDDTFNVGTGANSTVCTASIQSDGKVIIGGVFTSYSGTTRNRLFRLNSNGVLDTDFNVGTGANSFVRTTSIQSDGKVIIGGAFTSYNGTTRNRIARLHSNGILDTDFNVGTGANNIVETTSIQSDGRVIIGGAFINYSGNARNRIARLHSNGVLDTSFNVGTGTTSNVFTTSIQSDGRVIIGGEFTSYSGTARNNIARLHSNGVLDADFNVGTGVNNTVCTTSIQSDGRVIIGGFFSSYSGTARNNIARLHSNGVLDTDFNIGTGPNSFVYATPIQADGRVIIGGEFTSYSGTTINRIVRINAV